MCEVLTDRLTLSSMCGYKTDTSIVLALVELCWLDCAQEDAFKSDPGLGVEVTYSYSLASEQNLEQILCRLNLTGGVPEGMY